MIFQWKNKAIWLALTGSAFCLGFLGCSKPGGSGTSGNTPADGGVVTASIQFHDILVIREDKGKLPVSISFSSDTQDNSEASLSIDQSKLPISWSVDGPNSCTSSQYAAKKCIITLNLDESISVNDSFDIPVVLNNSKLSISKMLPINYKVVGQTNSKIVGYSGRFNGSVGGQPIPFTINFNSTPLASEKISRISFVQDGISDSQNWKFNNTSSECYGDIPENSSKCSMSFSFNPTTPASGSVKIKYSYIVNNGETFYDSISIPYFVSDVNKIYVSTPDQYINFVEGSKPGDATFILNTDGEIANGQLTVGSLPAWLSSSVNCPQIDAHGICSISVSVVDSSKLIGKKTVQIPLNFFPATANQKTVVVKSPSLTYSQNVPQMIISEINLLDNQGQPMSFMNINPESNGLKVQIKAYTPQQANDISLQLNPSLKLGWITSVYTAQSCDKMMQNTFCTITFDLNAKAAATSAPNGGIFTIPFKIKGAEYDPETAKIKYSFARDLYKVKLKVTLSDNLLKRLGAKIKFKNGDLVAPDDTIDFLIGESTTSPVIKSFTKDAPGNSYVTQMLPEIQCSPDVMKVPNQSSKTVELSTFCDISSTKNP